MSNKRADRQIKWSITMSIPTKTSISLSYRINDDMHRLAIVEKFEFENRKRKCILIDDTTIFLGS